MDRITHADDVYVDNGAGAVHHHMRRSQAQAGLVPPPLDLPTQTAGDNAAVPAFINDARWVATCPDCNETQIVSKSDPRMLCWECKNFAVEGQWRPVAFPAERAAIEAELLSWPTLDATGKAMRRRWIPGEKVADLVERKMDRLRPSIPRLEDLSPEQAEQVTAALNNDREGTRDHPVVSWADDERTIPQVDFARANAKATRAQKKNG